MLDLLQYYFQVLCNGMKMRFRMVMIAHPGPGIGFHKQFMWQIIIPPTAHSLMRLNMVSSSISHPHLHALPVRPEMPGVFSCMAVKTASLTSLLVMLWYSKSSGSSFKLGSGSFSSCGGSGNR